MSLAFPAVDDIFPPLERYYHVRGKATAEVITCHRIGLIPVEPLKVFGATLCAVWVIKQQVNLSSHCVPIHNEVLRAVLAKSLHSLL